MIKYKYITSIVTDIHRMQFPPKTHTEKTFIIDNIHYPIRVYSKIKKRKNFINNIKFGDEIICRCRIDKSGEIINNYVIIGTKKQNLEILKIAKNILLNSNIFTLGLSFCIQRAIEHINGFEIATKEIKNLISELNKDFFNLQYNVNNDWFWWDLNKNGYNKRLKAFDKLINHYNKLLNN